MSLISTFCWSSWFTKKQNYRSSKMPICPVKPVAEAEIIFFVLLWSKLHITCVIATFNVDLHEDCTILVAFIRRLDPDAEFVADPNIVDFIDDDNDIVDGPIFAVNTAAHSLVDRVHDRRTFISRPCVIRISKYVLHLVIKQRNLKQTSGIFVNIPESSLPFFINMSWYEIHLIDRILFDRVTNS